MIAIRPVVLLAGPGEPTRIVYHALVAAGLEIGHVVLEEAVPKHRLLKARAKRLGLRTVAGQLAFQGAIVPLLRRSSERRLAEIRALYGMDRAPIVESARTQVHLVPSANDSETLTLLRELSPSVVAVQGTRILSRKLLEAVGCPFINMHAGLTPLYRGVHGGYWAAASGHPELCGVTVHLVDPGIDTGGIIAQARVSITEQDCFVTYPLLQLGVGLPLFAEALRRARDGRLELMSAPPGVSRIWSHPTAWDYAWRRVVSRVR